MKNNSRGGYYPPAIKKRVLSLFLTMVMFVCACPITQAAAEEIDPSQYIMGSGSFGAEGDNLNWSLNGTGRLTISGSGAMTNFNYTYSPAPWYEHDYRIYTIVIEEGVTTIGDNSFRGCINLVSVDMPNSVTAIGDFAFSGCKKLKSVNMSNSVTKIGYSAFSDCTNLESIVISDSVTEIGYRAFENCTCLSDISLGDSIYRMHYSTFQNTGYYNNDANWDNDVLYIGKYLYKAKETISGSYTIKDGTVYIAEDAFENCKELTDVTIPSSVKYIDADAFLCSGINNIVIPEGVLEIRQEAFLECENLKTANISSSVKLIQASVFRACPELEEINVSSGNSEYSSRDGHLFNKDQTEFIEYAQGKKDKVYKIPEGISNFGVNGATYLEHVKIPSSCVRFYFNCCDKLKSVELNNSITEIPAGAFMECDNLSDVYFNGSKEEWNNINIIEREGDFFYPSDLRHATIHYNAVGTAAPKIIGKPTLSDSTVTVNLSDVEYDSVLIAAVYCDGVLKDMQAAELSAGDMSKIINISASGNDTLKVFIWDSFDSMNPLCEAGTV